MTKQNKPTNDTKSAHRVSVKFTEAEHKQLADYVLRYKKSTGSIDWDAIQGYFPHKDIRQLKQCHKLVLDTDIVKRRVFSSEDDAIIVKFVKNNGNSWVELCMLFPDCSDKQLRERYENNLSDVAQNSKKMKWTYGNIKKAIKCFSSHMYVTEAVNEFSYSYKISVQWAKCENELGITTNKMRNFWNSKLHDVIQEYFKNSPIVWSNEAIDDIAHICTLSKTDRDRKFKAIQESHLQEACIFAKSPMELESGDSEDDSIDVFLQDVEVDSFVEI